MPTAEQVRRWAQEADSVARELERIQERVLEHPVLRRMNVALGAEMQAALAEADPGLPRELGRVPGLETRAGEAERAGDAAALSDLTRELRDIERRSTAARDAALKDEQFAAKVRFFYALLERRMVESDPGAAALLARSRDLRARLPADPAVPPR